MRRGAVCRLTGRAASKCLLRPLVVGIWTGLVGVAGLMVKLKPSGTVDTAGETCFPMSASISDGQGVSGRMGVTVTVIADDLLLLCACFGSLACGGMMATAGLADSEATRSVSISTTAGFDERDGFGVGGRMGFETMEGGKRAGVGGCGSLGREVYSIMT